MAVRFLFLSWRTGASWRFVLKRFSRIATGQFKLEVGYWESGMALTRREFLQRASTVLAGLGISEALLGQLGSRYYSALAQPSDRKLALLVGIDRYGNGNSLAGCVTDVELQRELLIYRFGFQPEDILTLTDNRATRKNIQDAFITHLSEQARADDLVVVHFSGYGRRLRGIYPEEETKSNIQNTLVPVDSAIAPDAMAVNDLLEQTLVLMLRAIASQRIITVLDTSYTYPGVALQGTLRVRSLPGAIAATSSAEEQAFQQQLQSKIAAGRLNQTPGIILAAARDSQAACETQWNGFSCGLFTYALTQSLWLATPATTLHFSIQQAACKVKQLAGTSQQPQWKQEGKISKNELIPPLGFSSPPAEGVITAVADDGKIAQLWLGGLPARVLDAYGMNSLLSLQCPTEQIQTENASILQIRSRSGLVAQAQLWGNNSTSTSPLQVGQFVREAVRVLPRHPSLTVALDTGLERIERVDATSAFATIPHVSPSNAGEQPADCLFARVRDTLLAQTPTAALPSLTPSSYGLFSLGQDVISDTVGEGGEAVKAAVRRLMPYMQTLLAAKLWRMTANEGSSRLLVAASLEIVEGTQQRVLLKRETLRGIQGQGGLFSSPALGVTGQKGIENAEIGVLTVPVGSRIQYRLRNSGDRPIYYVLLGLDNRGRAIAGGICEAIASYPTAASTTPEVSQTSSPLHDNVIAPGETVTIPGAASASAWLIRGSSGLAETQLICSIAPFSNTLAAIASEMLPRGDTSPISVLSNPLPVAQALMQDLHQASAQTAQLAGISTDAYALDVNAWATLSFIYKVV